MHKFSSLYKQTFATLGWKLMDMDAMPERSLSRFERKMKFRLPRALREYYLLFGNAIEPDIAYNRLLPPTHWWLDDGKLVFMEENEDAVVWGIEVVKRPPQDPPVFYGVNEETIEWHVQHEHCSVFLTAMLHWQGTIGRSMAFTGTAMVPEQPRERLDSDWAFVGEINEIRAYNRPGQAICSMKWENGWRIFAGASSQSKLKKIAEHLGVRWDQDSMGMV